MEYKEILRKNCLGNIIFHDKQYRATKKKIGGKNKKTKCETQIFVSKLILTAPIALYEPLRFCDARWQ